MVLCCTAPQAFAAEAWQEYDQLVDKARTPTAQGAELFGDHADLQFGALSFRHTDISIPGNNALPVALTREYVIRAGSGKPDFFQPPNDLHFADWELSLPRVEGVFPVSTGWVNANGSKSAQRCSVANASEASARTIYHSPGVSFDGDKIWHGTKIHIGGAGTALLVARASVPKPSAGSDYRWVTRDWTWVSCLPSLVEGSGEGFLAITAEGTRYWFNYMAANGEVPLGQKSATGYKRIHLSRARYALYATRVEDRFGNWVKYHYGNAWNQPVRLSSIESSDGRTISVSYSGAYISSATDGTHTWTYQYDASGLRVVVLPDQSKWEFDLGSLKANVGYQEEPGEQWRTCTSPGDPITPPLPSVGVVKHPSGATGEFTTEITYFSRNVPLICDGGLDPNTETDDVSFYPNAWHAYALTKKRVTGAGLLPAEWTYAYDGTTTYATDPDGHYTVSEFGTQFQVDQDKLLTSTRYRADGQVMRVDNYTYQTNPTGQPYPARLGDSGQLRGDDWASELIRPLLTRATSLQGVTFVASNNSFDLYGNELSSTRSSSLGFSRTAVKSYFHNTALWVLGQTQSVLCASSTPASSSCDGQPDSITAETQFDAAWALPLSSKLHGKLQQSMTYNTALGDQAGTIATAGDGNGNVTTLSSWKRGTPQLIQYPATPDQPGGASKSAVVNNDGTIASVTDENGYKTCYEYDALRRVELVTYPSETTLGVCDTSKWLSTGSSFTAGHPAVYGLPAGHWRQTVQTGNQRIVTMFDALWRPVVQERYDNANIGATLSQVVTRYDTSGRANFVSYPQRTLVSSVIDTWANPALAPNAKGTTSLFDALGRATRIDQDSELGVLTTTTEYLPQFKIRVTPPKGQGAGSTYQTTTSFMVWDEPTTDLPIAISHPEGAFTDIDRDAFGKPLAITRRDANSSKAITRRYVYRPDWQTLCKTIEPETGTTVMDYDGAGNLGWSAAGLNLPSTTDCELGTAWNSGRVVGRGYDARNRVTGLSFPDGNGNQSWSYTADSRPASVTTTNVGAQSSTLTYAYNRRRLLVSEELAYEGVLNWPVGYAYDGNGHLAVQTWHGLSVDYAPNALGQPTQAGAFATGVTYHPNGAIHQFSYGNGTTHTLSQNTRGLPDTSQDAYGSTAFLSDGYDYDGNGNVAAITDGATGRNQRGNRTMGYDALDRLTSTVSPMFGTATFTYDVLDNLTLSKLTGGGSPRDRYYCYNAKWQVSFLRTGPVCTGSTPSPAAVAYEYDVQGNLTARNSSVFAFDYGNRLRTVSDQNSRYAYDGLGRRVWDGTSANKYAHYLQNGQLSLTADGRSNKNSEYIYLQGSLIAIREQHVPTGTFTVKYQHTDALGTPVAITDASRNVLERLEYEPYGRQTDPVLLKDGVGYTGHVLDAATGMNYMQQRYYDPRIGRFLSVDPVTVSSAGANFNRYSYANNNPYRFTDPDGRYGFDRHSRKFKIPQNSFEDFLGESNEFFSSISRSGADRSARSRQKIGSISVGRPTMAQGPLGRTSFESKIRVELAKGNWDEAAFLLENSVGEAGPAVARAVEAGVRLGNAGYTRNSLNHVFVAKHQLESLVARFGSQEMAMLRIHEAAQGLASGATNGTVVRGAVIQVGEQGVWVQGRVLDGIFRLSSASMRGVP